MPETPGKKRTQRSSKHCPSSKGIRELLGRQKVLSRAKALKRIKELLTKESPIPLEAIDLVALFHFQMDELTEAGIPYEMVRALEKRYPFLLLD